MDVSSHILKLKGNAELPEAVEITHNYKITLEGSITGYKVEDNENGTENRIYDFKPVLAWSTYDFKPVLAWSTYAFISVLAVDINPLK